MSKRDGDLFDLMWATCDGSATAEQASELERRALANADVRHTFAAFIAMHVDLQWDSLHGAKLPPTADSVFPDSSLESSSPSESGSKSATVKRRAAPTFIDACIDRGSNFLSRPVGLSVMASLFTIAAALLVLALVHLSLDDPSEPQSVSVAMADDSSQAIVAHVTRDIACRWSADAPLSLEPGEYRLRKGRRLELLSGVVEIEFVSGVRSAVRGPALFSLGSDNALRLDRGDAVARVPEYAIGFVLETPSAKAVDLGTEFSANVSAGGDSDFYVEQGSVEIHPKSDETPHKPLQLSAGMGIHIPRTGRFDIATSPKQGDFLRFRALPAPSVALEGSIRLLASPATSVADESLSDDDMISMFLEREEVVAPKGLIVSTDRPGQFENLDKIDQRLDESTSVDSYFIHFRPKTPAIRATTPIIARVTFDRPVVAVLASWRQLNDSDELFGSAETEYGPVDGRGLEISANGSADVISISADRRTVSLRIYGGGSRDELRILVRSAARP